VDTDIIFETIDEIVIRHWGAWQVAGILLSCLLLVGAASAQDSVYTQVFFTSGTSDGQVGNSTSTGGLFTGMLAGGNSILNTTTTTNVRLRSYGTTPELFSSLSGMHDYFDTSALPDDADIGSATFSMRTSYLGGNALGNAGFGIVGVTPITPGVVSLADYYNTSSDRYAEDILYSNLSIAGSSNYWDLNLMGIENISKTGWTNFALKLSWAIDGAFTGTWLPLENVTYAAFRTAEYGTTANAPNLTISYTIPGDPTVMGKLNNSATNLTISTYDGSGQAVHPSVIDNGSIPWNGYRYLMVMTPYALANPALENPSMRYANSPTGPFEMIAGQSDPVIPKPAVGFNSDPNIAVVGNKLYLFTRYADATTPTQLWYNRTNTTDGVTWGKEQTLTFPWFVRSASFIYNGTGWECLAHNVTFDNLQYFYSDETGLNFYYYGGALTGLPTSQWHSDAKLNEGQYQLLLENYQQNNLSYWYSQDGRAWFPSTANPVLVGNTTAGAWDPKLYKPSFTESNNTWRVWYGGYNASNFYYVGYAEYPSEPLLAQFTPAGIISIFYPNGVSFVDTSSGSPTSWDWQFNDIPTNNTWISFSTLQNPPFHAGQGNYSIRLNVSKASTFDISTQLTFVNVTMPSLAAAFSADVTNGTYPVSVNFTDESIGSPNVWFWDFGDGGNSTLQNATHIYGGCNQTFTVNLTVTNTTSGLSDSEVKTGYISTANCTSWCGSIKDLYFQNKTYYDPLGYQELSSIPSGETETDISTALTSAGGNTILSTFITPRGLPDATSVLAGLRTYYVYASVDNTEGTTTINATSFHIYPNGTEEYLYSKSTGDINDLSISEYTMPYVSPSDLLLGRPDDRVAVKFYGKTTSTTMVNLTFAYQGETNMSHLVSGYFYCAPPVTVVTTTIPNLPYRKDPDAQLPWWVYAAGVVALWVVVGIMWRRR